MKIKYGPYDINKVNIIEAPNGESLLAFPANMNPFKIIRMECFRNENDQVVISLMDGNSTMYTRDEWQSLLKTPPLQREHESKMDGILDSATDAVKEFLSQE